MNRMEEMMNEILKRLSPDSGSSSHSPTDSAETTKKSSNSGTPLERPTDLLSKAGSSVVEGTGLGTVILKKRRSKTRIKGSAPQVCLVIIVVWKLLTYLLLFFLIPRYQPRQVARPRRLRARAPPRPRKCCTRIQSQPRPRASLRNFFNDCWSPP